MNTHVKRGTARTRTEGVLTEWLLRAFGLIAYGLAVSNLARTWWQAPSRLTLLMLLVTEGYTLMLVLRARRAVARDLSPPAIAATLYAAYFFVLFDAGGTRHLVPEAVGLALQFAGLAWQVWSKVTLGRSFGLLPARRKLVTGGPYRVVRHPIYFGYLLAHLGFLPANFSWRNAAVLAALYVVQVLRLRREEAVLSQDPAYRAYMAGTRWRLVPGIF